VVRIKLRAWAFGTLIACALSAGPVTSSAQEPSAAILAAQRNCKILGIFTRLWKRDRKPGYLIHIPRLWRLLEADLRDPALGTIRGWLDRHLPPAARRAPDLRSAA